MRTKKDKWIGKHEPKTTENKSRVMQMHSRSHAEDQWSLKEQQKGGRCLRKQSAAGWCEWRWWWADLKTRGKCHVSCYCKLPKIAFHPHPQPWILMAAAGRFLASAHWQQNVTHAIRTLSSPSHPGQREHCVRDRGQLRMAGREQGAWVSLLLQVVIRFN